jgi:hypothetical protein
MVIRQKKFGNGKLVEMNYMEPYYYVQLREDAGDWMPWEVRKDGTRHIMSEITKDIDKAEELYDEYTRKARENG